MAGAFSSQGHDGGRLFLTESPKVGAFPSRGPHSERVPSQGHRGGRLLLTEPPMAGASPHRDSMANASPDRDPAAGPFSSQGHHGGLLPLTEPPMAVESPHTGRHPLATPAPPGAAGGGSVRARALREGGKHCEPVHFPRFYYLRELDRTCKRHNCEVASTGPLSTETAAGGGRAPGGSGGPEQRHLAPLGPKKTAKCLKFIAWHLSKFATSETD